MLPVLLVTVRTPSATVQAAGDWSLVDTHSFRLVPSNNTIASDGGAVDCPGVMVFGTGCHTSVSAGFPRAGSPARAGGCCAPRGTVRQPRSAAARTILMGSSLLRLHSIAGT